MAQYLKKAADSVKRVVIRTAVGITATTVALEVTTHLPSQGRSSAFYHTLSDDYVTPALRKLLDPETAHQVAVYLAAKGLAPTHHVSAIEQQCNVQTEIHFQQQNDAAPKIRPLIVPNGIGLAAGFDKDGAIVSQMLQLGFGFVEIGTVTLQPQPGNPKPRMFRLGPDRAIINRYGFNSQGADAVVENLKEYYNSQKQQQKQRGDSGSISSWMMSTVWRFLFPPQTPVGAVGINIGKNKDTDNVVNDYTSVIQKLGRYADYLVLNVSSPNTADLRGEWQNNTDNFKALLTACIAARNQIFTHSNDDVDDTKNKNGDGVPPLFVKLAPDLTDDELLTIANICMETGIDGIVVTNTTSTRPAALVSRQTLKQQAGGLSGAPVKDMSTAVIRKLYAATGGNLPIIGVGGVSNAHDAYEKFRAGAALVQIYSVLVYAGPGVVSRMRHDLAELLLTNGYHNLQDVIGLDHEDIYWQKRQARLQLQQQDNEQEYRQQQQELAAAATTTSAQQPAS